MKLQDELEQLEAYYPICNYEGRITCAALIDGVNDILKGKAVTNDVYGSSKEQLEERISRFYQNIDNYLT